MKRKLLSKKKLYSLAFNFLIKKFKKEKRWYGIGMSEVENLVENSEIKQFIDYIFEK